MVVFVGVFVVCLWVCFRVCFRVCLWVGFSGWCLWYICRMFMVVFEGVLVGVFVGVFEGVFVGVFVGCLRDVGGVLMVVSLLGWVHNLVVGCSRECLWGGCCFSGGVHLVIYGD